MGPLATSVRRPLVLASVLIGLGACRTATRGNDPAPAVAPAPNAANPTETKPAPVTPIAPPTTTAGTTTTPTRPATPQDTVRQDTIRQDTIRVVQVPPPPPLGEPNPRPYDKVITSHAKTRAGLFKTHRIGSKLFFEIPNDQLGREMLLIPRAARVPANAGYGGQQIAPTRVLRWERREHRVLLRGVSYEVVADTTSAIYRAVANSNLDPILASFNVEAYGPDSAPVIDVTRMYTSPPSELGPGGPFRGSPDPNRSFIERVQAFPRNVEVEATLTVSSYTPVSSSSTYRGSSGSASVLMHWSMVLLPDEPMMPRLFDKRVGYFPIEQLTFGRPEQRAETRSYLVRWRLEKKDPTLPVSEPVKPIVYYVDPATPEWLVPWVKRGIEDWQPAFEAAGFRNAIIAKDPPTPAEDPDWSPEDARYSVVRWFPSTIENATGPNVHDPRTGEIIESDIYMYHNIMNLQRGWYFTQVGHLDPRARTWPFPDSLMGRLVQFVVAHEVGHTLGLQHDQKGSSTYPVDSVRSRTWVKAMGHTPSIMDYARYNYVAQPEDSIDLEDLIPRIGPYDKWAIRWGYAPIPDAHTPDEEWATLDSWSRQQDTVPWFRFNLSDSRGADAGDQTEAVGDADPVKATSWGLESIKQIVPLLVPATVREGEDYLDLTDMYDRLVSQWAQELRHVTIMVGGAEAQEKYAGQEGPRYSPWPRARQKEAVKFLVDNAFETPRYLLPDDVLRRIEVEGTLRRINDAQATVLSALLNDRRLERMNEFDALATDRKAVYSLGELLGDLRAGIWRELSDPKVTIDAFRRELQRTYLSQVRAKILGLGSGSLLDFGGGAGPARPTSDIRSMFRQELVLLDRQLVRATPKAADPETRAHIADSRDQIRRILEPTK